MSQVLSHHIFLFPFSFNNKKDITLDGWIMQVYAPTSDPVSYNQHSYFHDFAEKILFNHKDKSIVEHYCFAKLTDQSQYEIKILDKAASYLLTIKDIQLRLFEQFKIGILQFTLESFESLTKEDILLINDFGRRIYPQYLDKEKLVRSTKENFLADRISLKNLLIPEIVEDFASFNNPPYPFNYIPNHITKLIGNNVSAILDDRMFVLCIINPNKLDRSFWNTDPKSKTQNYLKNDFWYQYIFVDGNGKTCQNDAMALKLVQEATNERWSKYNTLFGVSRYSFVGIASWDKINDDFLNLYSQMATICLAQRAAVIRFSDKIAEISSNGIETDEVTTLYKAYIEFRNKLFFREITAQEQGIELYDLLQKQMRLEKEVKDLDEEIAELNTFMDSQEQSGLTKVATYFLPASLLAAIATFFSDKDYYQFDYIGLNCYGYQNITCRYLGLIALVLFGFGIGKVILKWDNIEKYFRKNG